MEKSGFSAEDFASDPIDIWPENLPAFNLLVFLQTQWITGMNGPTGINYLVMHHKMDRMGLAPEQYDDLERDIQIMEGAALSAMRAEP